MKRGVNWFLVSCGIFAGSTLALLSLALLSPTLLLSEETSPTPIPAATPSFPRGKLTAVATPALSEDSFPCSDCHDGSELDTTQRVLKEEHAKIKLRHDEQHMWCLDCHDTNNRDKLHLASGKLIEFSDAPLLCGQCHGKKLREAQIGIHGKRTGSWSGDKEYRNCASCHSAHTPKFKLLKPLPPPIPPGLLTLPKEHGK